MNPQLVADFLLDENINIINFNVTSESDWLITFNEPIEWGTNDTKGRCGIFTRFVDGKLEVFFNSFKARGMYGNKYSGTFWRFVKLLKDLDTDEEGKLYFLKGYITNTDDLKKLLSNEIITTSKKIEKKELEIEDWDPFDINNPDHKKFKTYLSKRKIDYSELKLFVDIWLNRIYFPVYKNSELIFYTSRSILKYEKIPWIKSNVNVYPVYNLERVTERFYCVIAEGIFDALSVKNGIALLGTGSTKQLDQIISCNFRNIIIAMDNDKQGSGWKIHWADYLIDKGIKNVYIYNYKDIKQKDFNEMAVAGVSLNLKSRTIKYNFSTKALLKLGAIK